MKRPAHRLPYGWTSLGTPGQKIGARYRHDASGWEVRHCGHPTALYPYYAVDPAHPDEMTLAPAGTAFRLLGDACAAVEAVVDGEAHTDAGGNRGHRRIVRSAA